MTERKTRIVSAAMSLIKTPWHLHGRLPGIGLDCVGVLAHVAEASGKKLNDFVGYTDEPTLELARDHAWRELTPTTASDMEPGDVILFKLHLRSDYDIGHFGIYVGAGRFVHTSPSRPRMVKAEQLSKTWSDRIVGVYEIPRGEC